MKYPISTVQNAKEMTVAELQKLAKDGILEMYSDPKPGRALQITWYTTPDGSKKLDTPKKEMVEVRNDSGFTAKQEQLIKSAQQEGVTGSYAELAKLAEKSYQKHDIGFVWQNYFSKKTNAGTYPITRKENATYKHPVLQQFQSAIDKAKIQIIEHQQEIRILENIIKGHEKEIEAFKKNFPKSF